MKKSVKILVFNGQNEYKGESRATTERGYRKAARRIWPYMDERRVVYRVYEEADDGEFIEISSGVLA